MEGEDRTDTKTRKGSGTRRRGRRSAGAVQPPFEELQKLFDLPLCEAARRLDVSPAVLRHWCQQYHIARWPQRKVCASLTHLHTDVHAL